MNRAHRRNRPALPGVVLATGAAALFGASTPLVKAAGNGLGPFWTAGLLYLGAAAGALLLRSGSHREAALQRSDLPRLLVVALFGAVVGPVLLAWGLQRTSGVAASLALTLEAVFTATLALLLFRESIDRRVALGLLLLFAGGVLLVLAQAAPGRAGFDLGVIAVAGATLAWSIDNTLARALAERDPAQVVFGKCALGALVACTLAPALGEARPSAAAATALFAIGATGYGLSLNLYLRAQRSFGAARTGSVFAFAPFVGAALAVALGERPASGLLLLAATLMAVGLWLHLTESHAHAHSHEVIEHEHAHRHDDGHHDHAHDQAVPAGAHSHRHRHAAITHAHPHVPDAHHRHEH